MKELEKYVDGLFSKYKYSNEVKDLKDEILTNLEAKADDFMNNGMTYERAVEAAMKSIDSVDQLINENKRIYVNKFITAILQISLIYLLIAWIVTIPLRVMYEGIRVNTLLTAVVIALTILYFLASFKKDDGYINKTLVINEKRFKTYRNLVWIIWGIFYAVMTAYTTALHFASNIWFHRAIRIDGPYQFAVIAVEYLIPIVSIVLPLILGKACNTIWKYEVNE